MIRNVEVVRAQQRLDSLFKQITAFSGDPELQSHWAKYLCVLVSGFLETSVRAIYGHYTKTKAAPYVVNFVDSQLEDFQNPKMEKILGMTKCFSPEWESDLRKATEGARKDAIDSIVANRHRIAHGEWVGLTYVRIKEYYERAVEVVEMMDEQCRR